MGGGGVNLMPFLMFFCILSVFRGGGWIWDSGGTDSGRSPQEIAGNNTALIYILFMLVYEYDCE